MGKAITPSRLYSLKAGVVCCANRTSSGEGGCDRQMLAIWRSLQSRFDIFFINNSYLASFILTNKRPWNSDPRYHYGKVLHVANGLLQFSYNVMHKRPCIPYGCGSNYELVCTLENATRDYSTFLLCGKYPNLCCSHISSSALCL